MSRSRRSIPAAEALSSRSVLGGVRPPSLGAGPHPGRRRHGAAVLDPDGGGAARGRGRVGLPGSLGRRPLDRGDLLRAERERAAEAELEARERELLLLRAEARQSAEAGVSSTKAAVFAGGPGRGSRAPRRAAGRRLQRARGLRPRGRSGAGNAARRAGGARRPRRRRRARRLAGPAPARRLGRGRRAHHPHRGARRRPRRWPGRDDAQQHRDDVVGRGRRRGRVGRDRRHLSARRPDRERRRPSRAAARFPEIRVDARADPSRG